MVDNNNNNNNSSSSNRGYPRRSLHRHPRLCERACRQARRACWRRRTSAAIAALLRRPRPRVAHATSTRKTGRPASRVRRRRVPWRPPPLLPLLLLLLLPWQRILLHLLLLLQLLLQLLLLLLLLRLLLLALLALPLLPSPSSLSLRATCPFWTRRPLAPPPLRMEGRWRACRVVVPGQPEAATITNSNSSSSSSGRSNSNSGKAFRSDQSADLPRLLCLLPPPRACADAIPCRRRPARHSCSRQALATAVRRPSSSSSSASAGSSSSAGSSGSSRCCTRRPRASHGVPLSAPRWRQRLSQGNNNSRSSSSSSSRMPTRR